MTYRAETEQVRVALAEELRRLRESGSPERMEREREILRQLRGSKAKPGIIHVLRARLTPGCDEPWEAMIGDACVRRCSKCDRRVFHVDGMSERDLLEAGIHKAFVENRDGTRSSGPCPFATERKRQHRGHVVLTSVLLCVLALLGGFVVAASRRRSEVSLPVARRELAPPVACATCDTSDDVRALDGMMGVDSSTTFLERPPMPAVACRASSSDRGPPLMEGAPRPLHAHPLRRSDVHTRNMARGVAFQVLRTHQDAIQACAEQATVHDLSALDLTVVVSASGNAQAPLVNATESSDRPNTRMVQCLEAQALRWVFPTREAAVVYARIRFAPSH